MVTCPNLALTGAHQSRVFLNTQHCPFPNPLRLPFLDLTTRSPSNTYSVQGPLPVFWIWLGSGLLSLSPAWT